MSITNVSLSKRGYQAFLSDRLLEHSFTHHPVAAKVFYLLLQLAHTLAQLIERGSLFGQAFPKGVGSAKNLAWRLLEAWRNARLSAQHIQHWLDTRVQIRFQPP